MTSCLKKLFAKSALSGSPYYQSVRATDCRSICRLFNQWPVRSNARGRVIDIAVLILFSANIELWIISLLPTVERSSFSASIAAGTIFSDEDVSFSVKQFFPFPEVWPPHPSWPCSWPRQDRHRSPSPSPSSFPSSPPPHSTLSRIYSNPSSTPSPSLLTP